MPEFGHRIDLAANWLEQNVAESGAGGSGWGWVPDVAPNPQNTAEVVCAFTAAGRTIPRRDEVLAMVRQGSAAHHRGEAGAFDAVIDLSWRLRALRCLLGADSNSDPDTANCIERLCKAHDARSGGWSMAGVGGEVSVTATCVAVLALRGHPDQRLGPVVQNGVRLLIGSLGEDGQRGVPPLYAVAQIAFVLSQPDIAALGGPETNQARERAVKRVLQRLRRDATPIDEESFQRGDYVEIWRHTTLQMCLRAVAEAAPDEIFAPPFRRGLVQLLELQEMGSLNVNQGGFRTSAEGFITTYATTQAIEVLASLDQAISTRVNPAQTFDFLCRSNGAHHTDPQPLVNLPRVRLMLNSHAGAGFLTALTLSGATIVTLAFVFSSRLGEDGTRALLIWGSGFVALGSYVYLVVRFPWLSKARIAVGVFTALTAIVTFVSFVWS